MEAEVPRVDQSSLGRVNYEAVGAWDRVVDMDGDELQGSDAETVPGPELPELVAIERGPRGLAVGLVEEGGRLAAVDGYLRVDVGDSPHVVPVKVTQDHSVHLGPRVPEAGVLERLLGIQPGDLREESELE